MAYSLFSRDEQQEARPFFHRCRKCHSNYAIIGSPKWDGNCWACWLGW